MFLHPASRYYYWTDHLPWAALDAALGDPRPDALGLPRRWRRTTMSRFYRRADGDPTSGHGVWQEQNTLAGEWRRQVREHADTTTGLHLLPDPERFIVFDLDLRDQAEYRQAGCAARHEVRTVCPACWAAAIRAGDAMDAVMVGELGLAPPLVVYTGGGGCHFWYRLPYDAAARERAADGDVQPPLLSTVAERVLLTEDWVDTKERRAPAGFHLDLAPTTNPRHMIRLPFSLHETTGRVAIPLASTRAAVFERTEDFAEAVQRGVTLLQDWAGREVR